MIILTDVFISYKYTVHLVHRVSETVCQYIDPKITKICVITIRTLIDNLNWQFLLCEHVFSASYGYTAYMAPIVFQIV